MIKLIGVKAYVLLVVMMMVLVACSSENSNQNSPEMTPTAAAKEEPLNTTVVEEETVNNSTIEDTEEAVAASYLEKAAEKYKSTELINYSAHITDSAYYYDQETNLLRETFDYTQSFNVEMRRFPTTAYSNEYAGAESYEFDSEGNSTLIGENSSFTTTYLTGGDSKYVLHGNDETWYKYPLSDQFKTVEHIEDMLNLFLLYPDQLIIIEDFDEGIEKDYVFIEYQLTKEQFVEHIIDFQQSFFTGYYDIPEYKLFPPDIETVDSIGLMITLDKQYNIVNVTASYIDALFVDSAWSSSYDYKYYSLLLYFYPLDSYYYELPDDVRETAIIPVDN